MSRAAITLCTEGGYPFAPGGVSAWCDQLVRAVPELDVEVLALTGSGRSRRVYTTPANVVSVTEVPLWAPAALGRPPRGRTRARFRECYAEFLDAVLAPVDPVAADAALRLLHEYAHDAGLGAALGSDDAVALLVDRWRTRPPGWDDPRADDAVRPSLGDAATVTTWIEHMLRPLGAPVPSGVLVHCASNGLAGLLGLAARWVHGTPLLVSEHGVYLRERYLAFRDSPYGWATKWMLMRLTRAIAAAVYDAATVVAPGNVYNRRWEERLGADPDAIRTVYNGVDAAHYAPAGPEPTEPTIVYVGRIDPLKDLETLLRGFALVRDRMPRARLRIFGTPAPTRVDYLDRCRRLADELALGASTTFEGRAPEARTAYAAAQIVVLTSISEGFPYTVLEAMSSGRATVSTDVGGIPEAVGDAGVVVPARDPEALAAACVRLLRDPKLRARNAAASRERVLRHFTVERAMGEVRGIYAELLGPDAGLPHPDEDLLPTDAEVVTADAARAGADATLLEAS